MRILALDVGKGTQDLLLYDTNVVIENSPKMVMPSQTTIVGKRVRAATALGCSIFLYGETMGGGRCSAAIKAHLGLRYSVSVSYTHLRAHETGRNLVCRLLLEKK